MAHVEIGFGDCELSVERIELRRAGQIVDMEPQVFDVLAYLLRHRERVVPKTELLDQIWGNRFVSESALSSRVKSVRRAVGDTGRDQRVIKTIYGRGYRFVADVREKARFAGPPRGSAVADDAAALGTTASAHQVLRAIDGIRAGTGAAIQVSGGDHMEDLAPASVLAYADRVDAAPGGFSGLRCRGRTGRGRGIRRVENELHREVLREFWPARSPLPSSSGLRGHDTWSKCGAIVKVAR
jgi:DNA-binding winged helix-turn-helix (wHTH) protein